MPFKKQKKKLPALPYGHRDKEGNVTFRCMMMRMTMILKPNKKTEKIFLKKGEKKLVDSGPAATSSPAPLTITLTAQTVPRPRVEPGIQRSPLGVNEMRS